MKCCCTSCSFVYGLVRNDFRYMEETRSTLQFASRAKLVKTNATVNEVLDDSAKLRRLTKELQALKDLQRAGGVTDVEYALIESEKEQLLVALKALQEEKEVQRVGMGGGCTSIVTMLRFICCLLSVFALHSDH